MFFFAQCLSFLVDLLSLITNFLLKWVNVLKWWWDVVLSTKTNLIRNPFPVSKYHKKKTKSNFQIPTLKIKKIRFLHSIQCTVLTLHNGWYMMKLHFHLLNLLFKVIMELYSLMVKLAAAKHTLCSVTYKVAIQVSSLMLSIKFMGTLMMPKIPKRSS